MYVHYSWTVNIYEHGQGRMQPQKKTVIEKALDVLRKRTRMDAVFLYEKTEAGLYGDGVVRFAHEDKEMEM